VAKIYYTDSRKQLRLRALAPQYLLIPMQFNSRKVESRLPGQVLLPNFAPTLGTAVSVILQQQAQE